MQRSRVRDANINHSPPRLLMTRPTEAAPVSQAELIKASLSAGAIGLLLAVALKFTVLSSGVVMGLSMATFLIAQAVLIQRGTGRRNPTRGWATVLLVALGVAVVSGVIMEL